MKPMKWEERFDEEFYWIEVISDNLASEYGEKGTGDEDMEKVKAFIQAELQRQRREIVEWAKQHKATGEYFSTNEEYQKIYYDGRNQALDDIIKKVEK